MQGSRANTSGRVNTYEGLYGRAVPLYNAGWDGLLQWNSSSLWITDRGQFCRLVMSSPPHPVMHFGRPLS